KNRWRNKRSACGIVCLQRVGHPLRRKKNSRCKPNPAHGEIETTRYLGKRSDFRIVNPAEPICLHHSVPDAPDKRHEHNSLEVPHGKSSADDDQKNRRTNKTPSETLKERTVAVRSNHSRQVVSHRAKGGDEEINVFGSPKALCSDKDGHQQERCANVKNQVSPTVKNPQTRLATGRWRRRRSRHRLRR